MVEGVREISLVWRLSNYCCDGSLCCAVAGGVAGGAEAFQEGWEGIEGEGAAGGAVFFGGDVDFHAQDVEAAGGGDAEFHSGVGEFDDLEFDVVTDEDAFAGAPGDYEHEGTSVRVNTGWR